MNQKKYFLSFEEATSHAKKLSISGQPSKVVRSTQPGWLVIPEPSSKDIEKVVKKTVSLSDAEIYAEFIKIQNAVEKAEHVRGLSKKNSGIAKIQTAGAPTRDELNLFYEIHRKILLPFFEIEKRERNDKSREKREREFQEASEKTRQSLAYQALIESKNQIEKKRLRKQLDETRARMCSFLKQRGFESESLYDQDLYITYIEEKAKELRLMTLSQLENEYTKYSDVMTDNEKRAFVYFMTQKKSRDFSQ
jgi:hypothetical protein